MLNLRSAISCSVLNRTVQVAVGSRSRRLASRCSPSTRERSRDRASAGRRKSHSLSPGNRWRAEI